MRAKLEKRRVQLCLVILTSLAVAFTLISPSQAQRPKTFDISTQRALVEEYCIGCHNRESRTGGISLEGREFNKVGVDAEIWEKVLRKVRTGQMPHPDMTRPDAQAVSQFVNWLEGALGHAARINPNP